MNTKQRVQRTITPLPASYYGKDGAAQYQALRLAETPVNPMATLKDAIVVCKELGRIYGY
jgi:hypothetical protein